MILRWKTRTRMTSGTVTITDAAMMLPHGISNWELPESSAMATGTVRCSLLEVNVRAKRNSFHAPIKARSPVVASVDRPLCVRSGGLDEELLDQAGFEESRR
jgi:hypothetical protein